MTRNSKLDGVLDGVACGVHDVMQHRGVHDVACACHNLGKNSSGCHNSSQRRVAPTNVAFQPHVAFQPSLAHAGDFRAPANTP
jgi:hypothetical protein